MSITYEEALGTLTSMFGDPWTQDHLDSVLRHFEGHMENTVEAVLTHGSGAPDSLIAKLNSGNDGVESDQRVQEQNNFSMDEELARQLSLDGDGPSSGTTNTYSNNNNNNRRPQQRKGPERRPGCIGTPTELPADFLRVVGASSNSKSTLDADEALARMLQDDLFTEELANNPEFAHLARGRMPGVNPWPRQGSYPAANRGAAASVRTSTVPNPEGPNVLDKLSEMGENAKRRLNLFARNWQERNNNAPTGASIGQTETRGLLSSAGEDDLDFYEMKPIGQQQQQGKKHD